MIIKINGIPMHEPLTIDEFDLTPYIPKTKSELKKIKKLAMWLWGISGTFLVKSQALAADTQSMWIEMQPLWSVFQDIALVLGGIVLFIGIITFLFKRSLGKSIVVASALVVGGCFLVPSALMLIAIVGSMLNDVLIGVFENMRLENSVEVGG